MCSIYHSSEDEPNEVIAATMLAINVVFRSHGSRETKKLFKARVNDELSQSPNLFVWVLGWLVLT